MYIYIYIHEMCPLSIKPILKHPPQMSIFSWPVLSVLSNIARPGAVAPLLALRRSAEPGGHGARWTGAVGWLNQGELKMDPPTLGPEKSAGTGWDRVDVKGCKNGD